MAKHLKPSGDSPVQQGEARATNINHIVESAKRNGFTMPSGSRTPMWGDFSEVDFHQAQNTLVTVKSAFAELPAKVRNLFDNDPATLIRWVQDPANAEQALKLGLRVPDAPKPKTVGEEVAEALAPLFSVQEDLVDQSERPKPRRKPDGDSGGHITPLD